MTLHEKGKFVEGLYREVDRANDKYYDFWKEHTFLHWDWWLSLGLTLIPWAIWWKLSNKESRARFMFSAFYIIIISCWFNFLGVTLGFWYYTGKVIPSIPSYAPWDFCLVPVSMTIFMQFKPYISPFKKALVYGILVSFVGEPLFDLMGFYTMVHWEYYYSFPFYTIIYLSADWVSKRKSFKTFPN